MVTRRTNRRETAPRTAIERHVHAVQHTPRPRGDGIPGALAHHRVGIEPSAAGGHRVTHARDVVAVVRQREFVLAGMPSFHVQQRLEERRVVLERARYGDQPADMLRVFPPGVVPAAIGMRNQGNALAHGSIGWERREQPVIDHGAARRAVLIGHRAVAASPTRPAAPAAP